MLTHPFDSGSSRRLVAAAGVPHGDLGELPNHFGSQAVLLRGPRSATAVSNAAASSSIASIDQRRALSCQNCIWLNLRAVRCTGRKPVSKDGKPLAGAAKTSVLTECKAPLWSGAHFDFVRGLPPVEVKTDAA
jgi:hypothetical protein